MSEEDRMSDDIGKLTGALTQAQAEFQTITAEKTGQVGHRKYKYADLNDIIEVVRPILSKHGLAIIQRPLETDGDVVRLETLLTHESNQYIGSVLTMKPANATPQGIGSTITYARRYSLAAMLGLSIEEDDDGKAASVTPGPPPAKKPPPQRINEITRGRIFKACEDLNWTPEKLGEVLRARGITKLGEMALSDAEELAKALEKKHLDDQAKEAFS